MKRKAVITHTRPNSSVEFYKPPVEDTPDWDALFISGALIEKSITNTLLTTVYVNIWRSKADADSFGTDPQAIERHRKLNLYNDANGITKTLEFFDIPD